MMGGCCRARCNFLVWCLREGVVVVVVDGVCEKVVMNNERGMRKDRTDVQFLEFLSEIFLHI